MYYIYHIPGVKIGCTKNLKSRIRNQGFTEYEVLEEHYDINIASDRERELQRNYGYDIDKGNNVYSNLFANMGKRGGGKNTKKQNDWRKKWGTDKAAEIVKSGGWEKIQKKAWVNAGKRAIKDGSFEKYRLAGTEASKKAVLVFDKNDNFIKEYESAVAAAKELGMASSTIGNAINGRTPSRKYNFKFKNK
jgi:hypothetical protein